MRILIIFYIIILCICACTREEIIDNLKLPQTEEKLVVYCLITPDDSIQANIRINKSFNEPKNSDQYDAVNDAQVLLFNGENDSIQLSLTQRKGVYGVGQQEFRILPGQSYFIKVSTPDGKMVTASCIVPPIGAVFDTVTFSEIEIAGYKRYRVVKQWKDVSTPEKTWYYHTAEAYYLRNASNELVSYFYDGAGKFHLTNQMNYAFDISKVGSTFFMISEEYPYEKYDFYLFTIDSHIYEFYESSNRMETLLNSRYDPFGTYKGIIPEYSNIKDGLGIFGGYLKTGIVVNF